MTRQGLRKALLDVLMVLGVMAVPAEVLWVAVEVWPDPLAWEHDARQVWHQANRIRDDEPLYRPIPGYGPHTMPEEGYPAEYGPYPPLLGSVAALLPRTDLPTFDRAWYLLLLVGLWGYAAALGWLASGRPGWRPAAIGHGVLLLTPGTWFFLQIGQVDPLLWALFGLALAWAPLRGAGMTLTALVKPYAVFPLALALLREGKRVLLSAAAAAGVSLLLFWAAIGAELPATLADWFRHVPAALGQGTWARNNVSLGFAPLRLARSLGLDVGWTELHPLARGWVTLASVSGPLLAAWLTRRKPRTVQYGVVLVAALLFAPTAWIAYLPYALAPAAAFVGWRPPSIPRSPRVSGGCNETAASAARAPARKTASGPPAGPSAAPPPPR